MPPSGFWLPSVQPQPECGLKVDCPCRAEGFCFAAQVANSHVVAGGGLGLSPTSNLHPYDPEHLIVNGLGGAFLHPTHVFAPARFASVPDPHADELFEQSLSPRGRSPKGGSPRWTSPPRGRSPSRGISRRGSFVGEPFSPVTSL